MANATASTAWKRSPASLMIHGTTDERSPHITEICVAAQQLPAGRAA
jgi:hypothetical protein